MEKKEQHKPPAPGTIDQRPSPLAELLRERGFAESAAAPPPPASTAKPDALGVLLARAGKLILRREKKGHGGKTVTLLSGLDLRPAEYELLAKALRKGLGCGSTVEEKTIVLQGDIQQRAETWLRAHGATKVIQGN